MTYDINDLDELIGALDGPSRAAEKFPEISPQAICNWRMKGFVPPSRHVQVILVLKKLGKTADPALFDLSEDDARLLGLSPERAA